MDSAEHRPTLKPALRPLPALQDRAGPRHLPTGPVVPHSARCRHGRCLARWRAIRPGRVTLRPQTSRAGAEGVVVALTDGLADEVAVCPRTPEHLPALA